MRVSIALLILLLAGAAFAAGHFPPGTCIDRQGHDCYATGFWDKAGAVWDDAVIKWGN